MVAETNSGIVIAKIAPVETIISIGLSRLRPVNTPRNIARGIPTDREHPARKSEFLSRSPTNSPILVVPFAATPKSPCRAAKAHSKYRTKPLLFRPKFSLQFSRSFPKASLSRKAVHASPGNNSTPVKIIIETIITVKKPSKLYPF